MLVAQPDKCTTKQDSVSLQDLEQALGSAFASYNERDLRTGQEVCVYICVAL